MFHTLSMSIIGGYLIAMALLAYGLRLVGGDWGRLLQITFLFATALLGLVIALLPRFRAMLRLQIAKNFFAYRYDYRVEWLRFIKTVSEVDVSPALLPERVVEAVCTVVDSPGGALFAPGDDGTFDIVAQWHWRGFAGGPIRADGDLAAFLGVRQRVIDLDELRDGGGDYDGLAVPAWAATDRGAWLVVPLLHLDALRGFIVVERTLARRTLNWEDFELLRTLGRQSASYIAEATTQAELDEAGKFDEFNRRFAFIMHDIKNLVSQLSLVARNAERHADNPAFRADMVATLQGSVGKMNDLLARLAQRTPEPTDRGEAVDLGLLLADVVSVKSRQRAALTFAHDGEQHFVTGDPVRFEALFGHLIQNAIEASAAGTAIAVTLGRATADAVVTIADHGAGHVGRLHPQPAVQAVQIDQVGRLRHRRVRGARDRPRRRRPARSRQPRGRGDGVHHPPAARAADRRVDPNDTPRRQPEDARLNDVSRKLLVVEDDEGLQRQLRWSYEDYDVVTAGDRTAALAAVEAHGFPVVTLDLGLPPDPDGTSEGFATLDAILSLRPGTKVIVASGHGARASGLRAIASGAFDFYAKPIDIDELGMIVRRAYHVHDLEAENRRLRAAGGGADVLGGIVTGAPEMLKVARMIERVATRRRLGHAARRERDGQGTPRPRPARRVLTQGQAVRRDQLRGNPREPPRGRAVRL